MSTPSFISWLRAQSKSDPDREQAFAGLYAHGRYLAAALGENPPDPAAFKAHLVLEDITDVEQDVLLRQLIIADATWRTDSMDDEPEPDESVMAKAAALASSVTIAPIKPTICGFRDLDGTQCRAAAVEGAARCRDHGGAITDPAVRGSLLLLAYAQLTQGTKKAVETLIDVAEHSTNDLARVNAAKELLDRAGLSVDQHHTVTVGTGVSDSREDSLERIKRHLDSTRSRLLPPAPDDDDIAEGELVETDAILPPMHRAS